MKQLKDYFSEISHAKVDALFEAMDLVAGRMVYLMSLRSNESSRVTFDIEHSMTVEIVSEYLEEDNFQVRFFGIDYFINFLFGLI